MEHHIPVLLEESIQYLISDPDGVYFDGTVGFGGHTSEFLKKLNEKAIIIATDKDEVAYEYCQNKFKDDNRVNLFKTGFTNIDAISKIESINAYDGIFADLGVSSFQIDNADAGFTYREDSVLDLRMDKSIGKPAFEYLNTLSQKEIADIIYQYGEEKKSRQIAKLIVDERKVKQITRTKELKEIVEKIVPERFVTKTLSRVFQALRIYVNNELDELKIFLQKSTKLLKEGGKLVLLTYHSLEDRIVKEHFVYEAIDCICPKEFPICVCEKRANLKILTRKPIAPSLEETKINKRSRSAKLRAAIKL